MRKKFLVGILTFAMVFSVVAFQTGGALHMVHAAETSTKSGVVDFGR